MANVDMNNMSTMLHGLPPSQVPPIYTAPLTMDGNRAYSTAGSTISMPTSAPSIYNYHHPQAPPTGAQSTTSNASLETHMSQLSRTMIQLTQANQLTTKTQQENQQAMIDAQKQHVDAFNALVDATQQWKFDALFAAIPKFDGKNKEECTVWMGRIDSLCVLTGRNLRMELLNRAEGDVMTMLAGMNEDLDEEDVKEELMRCFSNAPTTIQAIEKLRGMKQRSGETARLYAARYAVIHSRANQLTAEQQNQSGEIMFYAETLQNHLGRKLLKRIHCTSRPLSNLWETFDLTLEFEKEYQINQPWTDFAVMETCYEEPTAGNVFMTEEVQTWSQSQQKGQYPQGNQPLYQKQQNNGQKSYQGNKTRPDSTKSHYQQGPKQQHEGEKPYYQPGYLSQGHIQDQGKCQPRIDFGMVFACSKLWIGTVLGGDQGSQVSRRQVQKLNSQLLAKKTGSTKTGPNQNK